MMKLKFFFCQFQILGPLGCQGWVVIPQNVKKSKSLHPKLADQRRLARHLVRAPKSRSEGHMRTWGLSTA